MAHRIGLSVPLGYCLLLAACAVWSGPPVQPQRNAWLPADSVSLLERSYLRCLRTQLQTAGTVLSGEEERMTLVHQRDLWAGAAPAFDLSRAPLQHAGRQLYIACPWFLPAVSYVRTCDTAGRCVSRGQFDE